MRLFTKVHSEIRTRFPKYVKILNWHSVTNPEDSILFEQSYQSYVQSFMKIGAAVLEKTRKNNDIV